MSLFAPKITLDEHDQTVAELEDKINALSTAVSDLTVAAEAPGSWLDSVMTRRIVVHCKDDNSIDGSLTAVMADGIVLRAAKLLTRDNQPTPMAGEVFIPRENVAFTQLDD